MLPRVQGVPYTVGKHISLLQTVDNSAFFNLVFTHLYESNTTDSEHKDIQGSQAWWLMIVILPL